MDPSCQGRESLSGKDEILHLSSFIKPATRINYHKPSDLQQRTHTHTHRPISLGPPASLKVATSDLQLKFNREGQTLMLSVSAWGAPSHQSVTWGRLDVSYCSWGVPTQSCRWRCSHIDRTGVWMISWFAVTDREQTGLTRRLLLFGKTPTQLQEDIKVWTCVLDQNNSETMRLEVMLKCCGR